MPKTIHMCINVRGALRHFKAREWIGVVSDGDRTLTPNEAKEWLFDALEKGLVVLPIGQPCEGFDFSGGGCPGHEEEEGK